MKTLAKAHALGAAEQAVLDGDAQAAEARAQMLEGLLRDLDAFERMFERRDPDLVASSLPFTARLRTAYSELDLEARACREGR